MLNSLFTANNITKTSEMHFKDRVVKKNLPALLTSFWLLCFAEIAFANPSINSIGPADAARPGWVPSEIIVKFKKNLPQDHISRINRRHGTSVLYTSPFAGFKTIMVPPTRTPNQMVELYSHEPQVEYAELNYYARAHFEAPNDPHYYYQWHMDDTYQWTGVISDPDRELVDGTNPYGGYNGGGINLEPARDITTGDPNVIVAVLDTGVAYETYKNFIQAPDLANTRFVPGYDFSYKDEHPNDDDGHGTHVTGTIAQSTNNELGVVGIAYNCSIMPVKVLNRRGEAPYATIADGVYFAADNGADIINMSLGGPYDSITLRDAVAYAYGKGVTIICSAGNDGAGGPINYPAAYNAYCIAVAATRYDQTRAYYSTTGSFVDLAAPGGDINIDQNGDGYVDGILQQTFGDNPKDMGYWFYQGTSMAAPHVSGLAALLISIGVTGPDNIREALENTAEDLGTPGKDIEYGWGLIDAYAALNYYHTPGDFNYDGLVDGKDLRILVSRWLRNEPLVDIAPAGGDGIINFQDFAKLAENLN
jgi:serine protease